MKQRARTAPTTLSSASGSGALHPCPSRRIRSHTRPSSPLPSSPRQIAYTRPLSSLQTVGGEPSRPPPTGQNSCCGFGLGSPWWYMHPSPWWYMHPSSPMLHVVVRGRDGAVWRKRLQNGVWQAFERLEAGIVGEPVAGTGSATDRLANGTSIVRPSLEVVVQGR